MTLGILYHMPFWQTADGGLWEAEGSFGRYVDSLAPDENRNHAMGYYVGTLAVGYVVLTLVMTVTA